eukprot:1376485-Rhodomonas_salina.2
MLCTSVLLRCKRLGTVILTLCAVWVPGSRFNMQKMKAGLPGPGQYDETNRDNFVAQLAKKRFSRGGHFGSTSKRFIPPSDKPKPREGVPSTYENKVSCEQESGGWRESGG